MPATQRPGKEVISAQTFKDTPKGERELGDQGQPVTESDVLI